MTADDARRRVARKSQVERALSEGRTAEADVPDGGQPEGPLD